MGDCYNQGYSREQIAAVLDIIQTCIEDGNFFISKNGNRKENLDFISNYSLDSKKQKSILMRIQPEDFCHTLQNTNPGFEHEILYVFCPRVEVLDFMGTVEVVDIYIKFNLISERRAIVISFHKRNKPIKYCFK